VKSLEYGNAGKRRGLLDTKNPGMHSCTPLILLWSLQRCWVWGADSLSCLRWIWLCTISCSRRGYLLSDQRSRGPAKIPDQTISGSALYKTRPIDTYRYCVHLDHNATPRCIAPPHQSLPHPQMPRSTWTLRALSHAHPTVPRMSIRIHSPQYHHPPH
jgi:hypothetical protein